MSKETDLMQQAKQLAEESKSWADFGNALFDPSEGLLVRAFPTRAERQAFLKTEECRQIQQLFGEVMKRHGRLEGANPTKVTEFMVQFQWTLSPEMQKDSPLQVHS